MYADQRILAIIPARGGSSRVPRKNLHPLAGKPLLVYAIEAAARVPEIDLCAVSTDDPDIAATARAHGARVIDRPAELSTAEARTEPALLHALDALQDGDDDAFDVLALLEPTSPLRRPATISRCIRRLIDDGGQSLLTVSRSHANPGRVDNGMFRPLFPDAPRRRQDREALYIEAGVVYVCRVPFLRATGSLVAADWLAEPVSADEAIDINEPGDFVAAETFLKQASLKQAGLKQAGLKQAGTDT